MQTLSGEAGKGRGSALQKIKRPTFLPAWRIGFSRITGGETSCNHQKLNNVLDYKCCCCEQPMSTQKSSFTATSLDAHNNIRNLAQNSAYGNHRNGLAERIRCLLDWIFYAKEASPTRSCVCLGSGNAPVGSNRLNPRSTGQQDPQKGMKGQLQKYVVAVYGMFLCVPRRGRRLYNSPPPAISVLVVRIASQKAIFRASLLSLQLCN